jgi:hypothetical protein
MENLSWRNSLFFFILNNFYTQIFCVVLCGSHKTHHRSWVSCLVGGHNKHKQCHIGGDCPSPLLLFVTMMPSKSNMYPNQDISKCYLCLLVHIECDKITLITLPSYQQEFSDITCEVFNLAFTLVTFPTFWACTSSKSFLYIS